MNAYLNNLLKMINKLNHMKNANIKDEYTKEIIAYALFIYYSGYITDNEFNEAISNISLNSYTTMYTKEKNETICDLINSNNILNDFYRKTLLLYYNYRLEEKNIVSLNKNIKEYFLSFLKYMNCYDLYCDIVSKKRISYTSPVLNDSICIGNKSNSYIVINEADGLYRYISLVHEIAHALENKTLKTRKKHFDMPYVSETMSITFSRIFLEYLKENNVLSSNDLNCIKINFEINCHRFIEWSFLMTEAVREGNFTISDYNINILLDGVKATRSLTDHNYSLGSVFSVSLLNMWRKNEKAFISDIPSMLYYLNQMDLKDLINFFDKHDSFEKELSRTLIKK